MANKRITDFTTSQALDGSEYFESVQGGTNTKTNAQQIKDFVSQEPFTILSGSTWDFSQGVKKTKTLSGNTSITITNSISGMSSALLYVTQDSTGSRTLTIQGTQITINTGSSTLVGIVDVGGVFAYDTNLANSSGSLAPTDQYIFFDTASGMSVASNVWVANSQEGWGHLGISSQTLPGNGRIYYKYQAADGTNSVLGLKTSATPLQNAPYFNELPVGVYIDSSNNIKKIQSDVGTTVGTATVGDYLGISRTGSTIKLQTSTDAATWTDITTYSLSTSATLYIFCSLFNDTKLYYPKGQGLS